MASVVESKPTSGGSAGLNTEDARAELAFARSLLRDEARALDAAADALTPAFSAAVDLIVKCAEAGGTLLVTGLGKSGLVGAKISATFASMGITSHNVHPSEAAHGDLGRFRPTDTVICISKSGETDEVVSLAAILRQDGLPIIAITAGSSANTAVQHTPTSLERLATVHLGLHCPREAGEPEFVAPTSTTTATMALGDALSLAAARRRSFTNQEFAKRHPGGALGGLLRPVIDVMRWVTNKNMPLIASNVTVRQALDQAAASGRRPGALVLVDAMTGVLAGIFTDGDLRRLVLKDPGVLDRVIGDVMTLTPRTLAADAIVRDAEKLFREHRQDEFPVVDSAGRPLGVLDVQDLIALRLVRE